jgi:hypothetical protein
MSRVSLEAAPVRQADEMTKRELFHECCGHVLARLDVEFPTPSHLTAKSALERLKIEPGKNGRRICGESIQWLADNGYIRIDGRHAVVDNPPSGSEMAFTAARLTDKGFAALNIQISLCGETERAGNALADQLKEAAGDARAAAVGKIVDFVTAVTVGAVKGFIS